MFYLILVLEVTQIPKVEEIDDINHVKTDEDTSTEVLMKERVPPIMNIKSAKIPLIQFSSKKNVIKAYAPQNSSNSP